MSMTPRSLPPLKTRELMPVTCLAAAPGGWPSRERSGWGQLREEEAALWLR